MVIKTAAHAYFYTDIFTFNFLTFKYKTGFGLWSPSAALIQPAPFALLSFPKTLRQDCRLSRTMSLVMLSGHTE